jgi:C-terminal processing protease CtpA/Prc
MVVRPQQDGYRNAMGGNGVNEKETEQCDATVPTYDKSQKPAKTEPVLDTKAESESCSTTSKKTFTVEVKLSGTSARKKSSLGIALDYDDGNVLVITSIEPGLIEDWNSQHPDKAVTIGDGIISVNGVTLPPQDLAKLIDKLAGDSSERQLVLTLKRHAEFDVALIRKDPTVIASQIDDELPEKLGIVLRHREGGNTLLVLKVLDEGLVSDFNRKHSSVGVQVGDRIIEVNGTRGPGAILNERVKAKGSLILTLVRCSASGTNPTVATAKKLHA